MTNKLHFGPMTPEVSDEFRMIKNNLFASSGIGRSGKKVLLVVGSVHREGVSTVARNLARLFAEESGMKVLLVDIDRKGPSTKGTESEPQALADDRNSGSHTLDEVIQETNVNNLYFLSRGNMAFDPSLQTTSDTFNDFFNTLTDKYPLVFIDSPPFQYYPEANLLASSADGIILVIESERTRREVVIDTKKKLASFNTNIIGVILNRKKRYIPEVIYSLFC